MLTDASRDPTHQPSSRGLQYYRASNGVIFLLLWSVLAVVIVAIAVLADGRQLLAPLLGGLVVVLALLLGWFVGILPPLAVRYRRYEIADEAVFIQRGFFTRRRAIVPLERVRFVAVKRGPVERRFQLATVVLQTAAGNESISLLDDDVAENLQQRLSELARRSLHDI